MAMARPVCRRLASNIAADSIRAKETHSTSGKETTSAATSGLLHSVAALARRCCAMRYDDWLSVDGGGAISDRTSSGAILIKME